MNTSMFFPVVEERDLYSSAGVQQDDINSVLEYVVKKVTPKETTQAADEDDDQPDYFHMVKATSFILSSPIKVAFAFYPIQTKQYNLFKELNFTSLTQEITSPPPDC